LKTINLRFVPGYGFSRGNSTDFGNFPPVPNWQTRELGEDRINKEHTGGCQFGVVCRRSYNWFFEISP
jgi:hypothetical protein